jgi:uncharacterized membrane protein required for colicin V production
MPVGDLAIIAAIAYQAWSGLRVGLVMGLFQLVVMAAGILGALIFEEPVAQLLEGLVPMDPDTRRFAVFFAITTGANMVLGFVGGRILAPLMARQHRSRAAGALDKALGLIPAALRGVIYAGSMVFMARLALPAGHDIRTALDASTLAGIVQTIFEVFTPYARMF